MTFSPVSALLGGVVGWVVRGKGQPAQPLDVPSAIEVLRSQKPVTYRKLTIDVSEARSDQEFAFVGDWLAIKDVNSTVDVLVRLNERTHDQLNLSRLRQIEQLYYRFFLTNQAGSGSVELFLSLGGRFYPPDATSVSVESDPGVISGTLANRPAPGLQNRLFWATDIFILYRDTGSGWERVSSMVVSDVVANRPAAGTADRFFYATDENVLYRDNGAAWEKVGVADHADLDGTGADDHHAQDHASRHAPGGGDVPSILDPSSELRAPRKTDPTTPSVGEIWINGTDAKYRDNQATPATQRLMRAGEAAGGDLGGTYPNPTINTTHAGSAHHDQDHAARHHSGGADALALGSIAGELTNAQHGSRTQANAHAHSHLSGVGTDDHHAQNHASRHAPGGGDALAVDAAAGTGSLRTLGTGAQQAAAGNHAHTLVDDTSASAASAAANTISATNGGRSAVTPDPGSTIALVSVTATFASGSRAFAAAFANCTRSSGAAVDVRLQLLMGGVQVAESSIIPDASVTRNQVLTGFRALSGSAAIVLRVKNNQGSGQFGVQFFGQSTSSERAAAVAVGSVKV